MYVDGFVVPVKRDRADDYRKMAKQMADLWIKHGALSVVEAMGDDVPEGKVTSFPMSVKLEPGEVVYFSWITYPDRATRDACNAKVMEEAGEMDDKDPPMNPQRMIFGGFTTVVSETSGA
ncbi:MAG: DUF1428 domain-containing protein [Cereibacter sphaeroides]|uniref:DUF1428 domain-containing protein n=1 Tax=Cereibacter sphaeroides TaxID=1063 RepID=A0A2W5SJ93_CERSP|nr:MAG: DUF1428 domain-containing protein [Cereibacter sphaeroides]